MTGTLDGYTVPAGHFDELRESSGQPREWWDAFARCTPDLSAATLTTAQARVARQIHDSTVTHSVYASDGRTRPWMLDVLPFVLTASEWAPLADGVRQHARLLNAVTADLYGAQVLLRERIVSPELVFRDAAFLRNCHGVAVPGGIYLHQIGFDVVRTPDGDWRLSGVRAQTPAGAGYALENRATILRMFPDAFRELHVRAVAPYFTALRETMARHAPCDDGVPHIVLLTPGPYSARYFEHAYLARYFGFDLVEGADLTARHDRVFLKTISGLRQVHGIVRQLADDFCDPLELRADSTLGVPGLVQAWRAGRVLVANAFGSGIAEALALRERLPAACDRLLGESWCGSLAAAAPAEPPASYVPVWHDGRMESRPFALRVFAVADGNGGYTVMPGGLARVAAAGERTVGKGTGTSKDTWVLGAGPLAARQAEPRQPSGAVEQIRASGAVSSRAAEHLFWLGRYVERADSCARLLRTALTRLGDPWSSDLQPRLFRDVCAASGLLNDEDLDSDQVSASELTRYLIDTLFDSEKHQSLAFNVRQTVRVAAAIRDRLTSDNWRLLNHLFALVTPRGPVDLHDALALLERSIVSLAAVAGIEIGHMRRDHGWRFLSVGRHLERLLWVATTFAAVSEDARDDPGVLESLLDLSDSLITFRARYLSAPEWTPVVELLLVDSRNPRSLAFQVSRLVQQLPQLPGSGSLNVADELARLQRMSQASDPAQRDLFGDRDWMSALVDECRRSALDLSDALSSRYFSHAYELARVTTAGR